jgi:hypothetical protein
MILVPTDLWVKGRPSRLASISTRNSSGNTIGVFGDESTTQAN